MRGGGEGEEQLSVSERTGNGPTEFGIWGGRGGIQHILTSASRLESYCCLPFWRRSTAESVSTESKAVLFHIPSLSILIHCTASNPRTMTS